MAIYIINRLPTPLLNWKTPYELLYGKQPSYSSLKIFRCLCYATNIKPHMSKFEPRAHKCVLLGFSPRLIGYRLYNIDSKQVFVSRDVIFDEHIFPFNASHFSNDDISLPLPITNDACVEKELNDLHNCEDTVHTSETPSETDEMSTHSPDVSNFDGNNRHISR